MSGAAGWHPSLPFAFQCCTSSVVKTASQGAPSPGSLALHPRKHSHRGWVSRTGLTALQPLLSKAKVCGVKGFLTVSAPVPVTHAQSPPTARCLQCRWGQSCHSNALGEASYQWLGRAGRGRKAWQGQEGDWKIDAETAWPELPVGWCRTSAVGRRATGWGKRLGNPLPIFYQSS